MVVFAAFGTLTPLRGVSLALAVVLVPLIAFNNGSQFWRALELIEKYRPPTAKIGDIVDLNLGKGLLKPHDPVRLAIVGEGGRTVGWVGPSGSFSPSASGFGVAIWALNGDEIVLNSDTFLAESTSQNVTRAYRSYTPVVETNTYYYRTTLTIGTNWNMHIRQTDTLITRLAVAIRSDGPESGRIHSLNWERGRLVINDRWLLTVTPKPIAVHVGEEERPGRLVKRSEQWRSEHGRGYAILEMSGESHDWNLEIAELKGKTRDGD